MLHFSQVTNQSPQSESKGKNNECLFSTPFYYKSERKDLKN